MKARFSSRQSPVRTITKSGMAYIYICLNEAEDTEIYPDMGNGEGAETYYEYDYNEIIGPFNELPLSDIQAHPEKYLEYAYVPQNDDPGTRALSEVRELKAAIERGMSS